MDATHKIRVGVRELRANLTRYLDEVKRGGSILVTSRNVVIAEIIPAAAARPLRKPGALKGRIWMADDFDVWPRELLDTFGT